MFQMSRRGTRNTPVAPTVDSTGFQEVCGAVRGLTEAMQAQQTLLMQFLQQARPAHTVAPQAVEDDERRALTWVKEFKKLSPPIFEGGPDPMGAESWLNEIKKILDVLAVPVRDRVRLAAFMLQKEANRWWDMVKRTTDATEMTWDQFKVLFLAKYFPFAVLSQRRAEFMQLVQKDLTVAEYESKFTELSRFVPSLVAEEEDRVLKFQEGLRFAIREKIAVLRLRTYADVVDRALIAEREISMARKDNGTYEKSGEHYRKREKSSNSQQQGQENPQDWVPRMKCHACGEIGHTRKFCPRKRKRLTQASQD